VSPPRVAEAQIALEGTVAAWHAVGEAAIHAAIEVRIVRTHIDEALLDGERRHHVHPDAWQPLVMKFLELCSTGASVRDSRLAQVF
jgi:flavin reductase (DIM6/NTAB) family NADH-FMN oxidoreductase RutF